MGKLTDALKKATEEKLDRLEKITQKDEVKYEFVARKTVESKFDPRIVAFYEPDSPVAEQYRTLRTNLMALHTAKPIKAITVTSAVNGEGKSITSINLAITMARDLNKKSILLIDCDLRRSKVSRYLGIHQEPGISEVIGSDVNIDDAMVHIGLDNLTVLPAGKSPHNPAELISSLKMRNLINLLRAKYDYVIIDTPPIIPVTDAGLMGPHTDGAIMVVKANRTQKGVVKHAEGLLKQAQVKILGHVLTNLQYHIPAYIYRYL